MADAAQRRFDVLLFWALDRFSREGVLETQVCLKRLDDAGVRFRSFTEPYLDSCGMFRDAVISILAVIAKQERVRISERVRAGLSRARRQGTRGGNPIGRSKVVFDRARAIDCEKPESPGGKPRACAVSAWLRFVGCALQFLVRKSYQNLQRDFGGALLVARKFSHIHPSASRAGLR